MVKDVCGKPTVDWLLDDDDERVYLRATIMTADWLSCRPIPN
jgi:hypothetical protein